jgi:hypothetical protein
MSTNKRWRRHLNDLMSASLDPIVYAVQWARDPRCLQGGVNHRRVGRGNLNIPVCALWSASSRRAWS